MKKILFYFYSIPFQVSEAGIYTITCIGWVKNYIDKISNRLKHIRNFKISDSWNMFVRNNLETNLILRF